MNARRWNRRLLAGVFIAVLSASFSAGNAFAVGPLAIDSVALELGTADSDDDVDRYGGTVGWDWKVKWLESSSWFLGGYWEFGIDYWDGEKGRTGNDSLVDFGFTPVFRYQRKLDAGIAPFLEFGVGPHLYTESKISDKDFDIIFAFGTHVGGGLRFGDRHQFELLYRYQHLSNAGLGDDNPGINFHIMHAVYRF